MGRVQPKRRASFRERVSDWFTDMLGIDGGGGPALQTDEEGFVWQDVSSSNVESIGWNPDTHELRIKFGVSKPTTEYRYPDFPVDVYHAFLSASSKGTFVWESIRGYGADNLHPYSKV